MGVVGLLVSATTARCLSESMNRSMPKNRVINAVSTMLASIVGFLLLSVDPIDGGFSTTYMGTKGLLASFISAFIVVNVYKFCVIRDITIKMPKEVPGTISQTFRDIIPFALSVFLIVLVDLVVRNITGASFAEFIITLLQPLFTAADGYVGISIIWGAMALFWFMGVHGPSIVEPAIAAIIYANVDANLALYQAGEHASNVLTVGLGNFVGTMGGTGATLILPFIFLLFAKSKQLKAVGKASVVPVCFAVNEPLLFATPIILNPYFFVPFICAPLGLVLGTGFSIWAFVLVVVLLVVDFVIYFPFFKAYDDELLEQERNNAEEEKEEEKIEAKEKAQVKEEVAATVSDEDATENNNKEVKPTNVLVLCAGAGTSAMLANALVEGAKELNLPISATAGAYGSHYEIMKDFDMIILAPQVASYYDDIKADADRLNVKLIATKGVEYINLTRDPKKAVEFVLSQI